MRSYSHADIHSSEICSVPRSWLYEGTSAMHIARTYLGLRENYSGMSFLARGYFVSTVGTDEEIVRAYIRDQQKEDQRL